MQVALNRPCRTNSNEQSKPDPNPFTNAVLQGTHHPTPTCSASCPSRKFLMNISLSANQTPPSANACRPSNRKEQSCQIHFLAEQTPLGKDTLLDDTCIDGQKQVSFSLFSLSQDLTHTLSLINPHSLTRNWSQPTLVYLYGNSKS
jgi:hypothetical protein